MCLFWPKPPATSAYQHAKKAMENTIADSLPLFYPRNLARKYNRIE
jgi:hypothetical protein